MFRTAGPVHYCTNGYGTLFIPKGYDFRTNVSRQVATKLCYASEGNTLWRSEKSVACAKDFTDRLSGLFGASYNTEMLWWGGDEGQKLETRHVICFLRKNLALFLLVSTVRVLSDISTSTVSGRGRNDKSLGQN